jgi:Acetyltransferase (GNAT) domain
MKVVEDGVSMRTFAQSAAGQAVLPVELESEASKLEAKLRLKVAVNERSGIQNSPAWARAFKNQRKDCRYFELVEETIKQGFDYRYFVLTGEGDEVRAIQPFFLLDQDLLAGSGPRLAKAASVIRRVWPRFLRMRTLMVGCAAGEGHLDARDDRMRAEIAQSLCASIMDHARKLKAALIVFKEFTVEDRAALSCLKQRGFSRIPSMPMTSRRLNFSNFEEYMSKALSQKFRAQLRRNCRKSAERAKLEMRVLTDITPYIEEIYNLYLPVYERSQLKFEKLTPEYFLRIGRDMPDKAVFFLMMKDEKIVSFNLCLKNGKELCSEYVGFDYDLAFDLHLYNVMTKNIMEWAITNGFEYYRSTSLNYEPKYHFRHELEPLDLYVRHVSSAVNFIMKRALLYLEPTRNDAMLKRFPNYADLRGNWN